MMTNQDVEKMLVIFSEGLDEEETKSTFEVLKDLTDKIENMDDPSPEIMSIYEASSQVLEKLKMLKSKIRLLEEKKNKTLVGCILTELYSISEDEFDILK